MARHKGAPVLRSSQLIAALAAVGLLASGCASPTPTDPSTEEATVSFTFWGSEAEYADRIAAFEEAYPNITLEPRPVNFPDYQTSLRSGLLSDSGPDVFQLQGGAMLDNFASFAEDPSPYMVETYGEDWEDLYFETYQLQTKDGVQVALPGYMVAAGFLWYDANILNELGLEVPTDVYEWAQVCETIKAAGLECWAHGAKDDWINLDIFSALVHSSSPGALYEAYDGTKSWTDPELVQAMEAWSFLFESGIASPGAPAKAQYPDAFNEWVTGKAAFIGLGLWNARFAQTNLGLSDTQATVEDEITGSFFATNFPASVEGGEPSKPFGGSDDGWAVSSKSTNKEAAYILLDFLAAGGGQEVQAATLNQPSLAGIEIATTDIPTPEQVQNFADRQEDQRDLAGYRQVPYPELQVAMGQVLNSVAAGILTPLAALEELQRVSDGISRG